MKILRQATKVIVGFMGILGVILGGLAVMTIQPALHWTAWLFVAGNLFLVSHWVALQITGQPHEEWKSKAEAWRKTALNWRDGYRSLEKRNSALQTSLTKLVQDNANLAMKQAKSFAELAAKTQGERNEFLRNRYTDKWALMKRLDKEWEADLDALADFSAQVTTQAAEIEKLKPYVQHKQWCKVHDMAGVVKEWDEKEICDCGLAAIEGDSDE